MRPTRIVVLGVFVALLTASLAVPALAQDDPEVCEEYPIGECLDEVDEPGDTVVPDDEDDEGVVLTRDTRPTPESGREQAQVLGVTLPFTGANLMLMLAAGVVLVLSGTAAIVMLRRRREPIV